MRENPSEVASSAAIEHLRWALTSEVGPILFGRLVERFGSAQAALGASVSELQTVEGIGPSLAGTIARSRDEADVQRELTLAAEHGVRILCRDDEEYPTPLRHIPDSPICLYMRGHLEPVDTVAVAVVGSRRCTRYGREQAYRLGYQLAQRGITVVSGLATPDEVRADKRTRSITARGVGPKETSVRLLPDGGTEEYEDPRAGDPCLDDAQALAILDAVMRAEALAGAPVDVEWAWARGRAWLLQSRPITA